MTNQKQNTILKKTLKITEEESGQSRRVPSTRMVGTGQLQVHHGEPLWNSTSQKGWVSITTLSSHRD